MKKPEIKIDENIENHNDKIIAVSRVSFPNSANNATLLAKQVNQPSINININNDDNLQLDIFKSNKEKNEAITKTAQQIHQMCMGSKNKTPTDKIDKLKDLKHNKLNTNGNSKQNNLGYQNMLDKFLQTYSPKRQNNKSGKQNFDTNIKQLNNPNFKQNLILTTNNETNSTNKLITKEAPKDDLNNNQSKLKYIENSEKFDKDDIRKVELTIKNLTNPTNFPVNSTTPINSSNSKSRQTKTNSIAGMAEENMVTASLSNTAKQNKIFKQGYQTIQSKLENKEFKNKNTVDVNSVNFKRENEYNLKIKKSSYSINKLNNYDKSLKLNNNLGNSKLLANVGKELKKVGLVGFKSLRAISPAEFTSTSKRNFKLTINTEPDEKSRERDSRYNKLKETTTINKYIEKYSKNAEKAAENDSKETRNERCNSLTSEFKSNSLKLSTKIESSSLINSIKKLSPKLKKVSKETSKDYSREKQIHPGLKKTFTSNSLLSLSLFCLSVDTNEEFDVNVKNFN